MFGYADSSSTTASELVERPQSSGGREARSIQAHHVMAIGVALPLLAWIVAAKFRVPGAFEVKFFAGFCLIANGAYLSVGSFDRIGDCGDLLRHGAPIWQLWLFGSICVPLGLWLWHGLSRHFGLGPNALPVEPRVAYSVAAIAGMLLLIAFAARS